MLNGVEITWLGHATFLITTPEKKKILVDPWLSGNPKCPEEHHDVETDAILITHGHNDHIGDVFTAADNCSGPVVGMFDLTSWLGQRGVAEDKLVGMNKGGRVSLDGLDVEVVMTDARHSSSFQEDGKIIYLGEPAGYVLGFSNGVRLYIAGDTSVFGDMGLIRELEGPNVAILPIGDHFTMDPRAAAHACKLLDVEAAIPCHFGTFGLLTGTPEQFASEIDKLGLDTKVMALEPGETAS